MRHIAAVAIALLIPGNALADEAGEEHLERAEQAEAAGEYATAQTEYIAAHGALKDPKIFYYLARAYEADGQPEPAVVYYRRYLREVEVPDQHRKEVLATIAALEPPPVEPTPPPVDPAPPAPEIPLQPPGGTPVVTAHPYQVPPPPRVGGPTRKTKKWYGWQIMLSDLATIVLAVESENGGVFFAGYFLGPAIIHAVNDNGGKALGSPALRAVLPFGGALLGAAAADCENSGETFCGLGEVAVGIVLGGLIAVVTDWSWSNKTIEEVPGYVTVGQCQGPTPCTTLGYGISW